MDFFKCTNIHNLHGTDFVIYPDKSDIIFLNQKKNVYLMYNIVVYLLRKT